jgi:hypothetical protein
MIAITTSNSTRVKPLRLAGEAQQVSLVIFLSPFLELAVQLVEQATVSHLATQFESYRGGCLGHLLVTIAFVREFSVFPASTS